MAELSILANQLCQVQGRLFEMAAERDLDSEEFIRKFMNSKEAAGLDDSYDRLQWLGEAYIMGQFLDENGGVKKAGINYGREIMFWIGYTYRYWHYYTGENSKEIYEIADAEIMSMCWKGYHTLDVKMAVDRFKESE